MSRNQACYEEIQRHPSYHGELTKGDAELILKQESSSCYLTRLSLSKDVYIVSVLTKLKLLKRKGVAHLKIETIKNTCGSIAYRLKGCNKTEAEFAALLEYYRCRRINGKVSCIGNFLQKPHLEVRLHHLIVRSVFNEYCYYAGTAQ